MKIIDSRKTTGEPTEGYIKGYGYSIIDDILENSRGFSIYQEDAMALFGNIVYTEKANSFSQALQYGDKARRVIAKKKPEELPALQEEWIEGCKVNGIDDATRDVLWNALSSAAEYQFNMSHAANYSLYSAQLAWFRYNFPIQFPAQRLNIKPKEKNIWITYCALNDIEIKPPRINTSNNKWRVEDDIIYAPVQIIHGLSNKSKKIVAKQPFSSVRDFEERVSSMECSITNKLYLWMMGYFNEIDGDFSDLITPYEVVEEKGKILVYRYKSIPQKRNNGKIKKRAIKDDTGKKIGMEEYVFEGKKELIYTLENSYDFYYNFMNGTAFFTKRFADICRKLDEADFEISFVDKVKIEESNGRKVFDIYCDGDATKPKLKIHDWMYKKYEDVFVPDEKSYIAYKRSDTHRYGIAFKTEDPRTFVKNGKEINWTYRKGFQLRDITDYLKEDL